MDRLNLLNPNVLRNIKVIVPGGPPSITGACVLTRDADLNYWNGTTWQASPYGFDVAAFGTYMASSGLGVYFFPWTPDAVGQYTFAIGLSSPILVDAIDILVEQVHFYEAENQV